MEQTMPDKVDPNLLAELLKRAEHIGPGPQVMEAGMPKGAGGALSMFEKMMADGAFSGERTVGSFAPTNLITGATEGLTKYLSKPARKLGERLAEFAPVGGEDAYNALRAIPKKVIDPAEEAFKRILMMGGR
jgi:hypothetical protein